MVETAYLPGQQSRARWMRMDTARILKRFFFCERALIIAQSGWLAGIADLDVKTILPRLSWQDAMTANALRDRVFELRYPSRLIERGDDAPVIEVFEQAIHAPSAEALILSLARVFKPALLEAYADYLEYGDELADGPTLRFLGLAVREKTEQIAELTAFADRLLAAAPEKLAEAEAWTHALAAALEAAGGLTLEPPHPAETPVELPGRRPFELAHKPARDPQFHLCRFYWPDVVDKDFPYGDGLMLQLRSAVSHINEAWAVETGGAILHAFADDLDWEFIYDAARWTYDESRHTRMGLDRLRAWGFEPAEIPLGTYIYDSAYGQDPIIRLGMLFYFETKNIGKKNQRAAAFAAYGDAVSQHDMEFDWADETIHAHYGSYWHGKLYEKLPGRVPELESLRARCDELVTAMVATATEADRADIRRVAEAMIEKARRIGLNETDANS